MVHAQDYLKSRGCKAELIQLHNLIPEKDMPKGL